MVDSHGLRVFGFVRIMSAVQRIGEVFELKSMPRILIMLIVASMRTLGIPLFRF